MSIFGCGKPGMTAVLGKILVISIWWWERCKAEVLELFEARLLLVLVIHAHASHNLKIKHKNKVYLPLSCFSKIFQCHICVPMLTFYIPSLRTQGAEQWFSTWASWPKRGHELFLEESRVDILWTQLHYICCLQVLDGGRWVIVGCNNGSQYKKCWKPLV